MTKNFILGKLTPFQNKQTVVTNSQGVNDIINGILSTHDLYKDEYDKISNYFYTGSDKGTAQKVWNYLKDNVVYNIESDRMQTLRSPAAILSMGSGADCKSYALFANGILDSLRRKGLIKGDLVYRFAGYGDRKDLEHVFSVLKTNKGEIWIDPVLGTFNQKKEPNYYTDKKINNMSLVAMAGIGDLSTDQETIDLSEPIDQSVMPDISASTIDTTMTASDGTPIINSDPTTGAYQEQGGAWYLQDGTALNNYDPTTGAYQEESGAWYAVDGTELAFYDPSTGNYQEVGSNVLYDANGSPIGTASTSYAAVPTKTSSVLTSGGGSGGGSGSGGGGSSASNGTTSALNSALALLNKLYPSNTKPLTAPKPIVKTATTPTTASSNTGTYLMIGLAAAAVYFLTKKRY